MICLFASDLHGSVDRYEKLFDAIRESRPRAVFLGGDLLPPGSTQLTAMPHPHRDFINEFLAPGLSELRHAMAADYPRILLILGNDDPRSQEAAILDGGVYGYWEYVHGRKVQLNEFSVIGYNNVPPTPFVLKDWERYDVSRFVDVGCISPEEGRYSVPVPEREKRYCTIEADLHDLAQDLDFSRSICLFHAPPHNTNLDRAALDGKTIDMVPLDVHVGSIAIRRFIERYQPLLTLHGHIHESARITGEWKDQIGRTVMLTAAHDGPELALVEFDPENVPAAKRSIR
jgi:Icc-related predicted phosphoesterase